MSLKRKLSTYLTSTSAQPYVSLVNYFFENIVKDCSKKLQPSYDCHFGLNFYRLVIYYLLIFIRKICDDYWLLVLWVSTILKVEFLFLPMLFKSMWNTMECKRDNFSGALGGGGESHWECVSHGLNFVIKEQKMFVRWRKKDFGKKPKLFKLFTNTFKFVFPQLEGI